MQRTMSVTTKVAGCALFCALLVSGGLAGCASAPRTESVQGDDLSFITAEAAAKLQSAAFFAERNASSARMVIAARRAVPEARNLQMPESERWYLVEKVGGALPSAALRERNVTFVVPEERARAMAAADPANAYPPERRPTHVLDATIRAANRSAQQDHTALYVVEYRVVTLSGGEVLWSDVVEYKRASAGKSYD
ncbi:MAG: hypothetical protein ACT4PL_11010 [Phycisphaerales bacterium]